MSGTLELFRRLIRQQTNLIGQVVDNIDGAVPSTLGSLAEIKASSWRKAVLQGSVLPTLDEFYTLWSIDSEHRNTVVPAVDGVILATEPNACLQLFRASLVSKTPLTLPLTVDTGSAIASFAVYVDGVLQRKASDAIELSIALTAGSHVVEIVAATQHIVIGAPATLELTANQESLAQPAFDSVTAQWLDAAVGTPGTKLIWNVDPRVGGYRVLRKQVTFLGKLKNVSDADPSGTFGVTLSGDQSQAVTPGETLSALHEDMGSVLTVGLYDSGSDETSFILRLTPELSASKTGSVGGWVGRTALGGHYIEIKRVRRTAGAGQFTVYDADVKAGDSYEYALQSYGLFDETLLSKESEPAYVRAGDVTPPGPITFVTGYPQVVNGRAIVRYTTPVDEDYDGTQVFFRKQYPGTVSSATSGSLTFTSAILNGVVQGTDTYELVITSGAAQGAVKKITSFTSSVVTLDANEQLSTLPINGDTAVVFVDFPVVTDRGIANSQDELTFDAKRYGDGDYFFRTFDFGNNLQSDADSVVWTYDHSVADALSYSNCLAVITSASPTDVTVTVTATATTGGTPQVRLAATPYNTTIVSGAAVGVLVASGSTWTFSRPSGQPGSASFEAVLSSTIQDNADVVVPEQGSDAGLALIVQATVIASTPTSETIRVVVADPVAQGNVQASISASLSSNLSMSSTNPQTVTPNTTLVPSGSNYADFVVTRPLYGTGMGRVVFTGTMANRIAGSDPVDLASFESTLGGTQILSNPSFYGGTTGYAVYDNLTSGKVTLSSVVDPQAPTPSGQVLRVAVAAGATPGTVVSPGVGGFYVGIMPDSGTYAPDTYHKNALITWIVRAKIPVGYQLNWASNSVGAEASVAWQTPQLGTGQYFEYRVLEQIGVTGTFSSTGFFYLTPTGTYDGLAFSWDVAQCSAHDRNRPSGDTVLPTLVLAATESGNVGTITASVVDPQNRVRGTGSGIIFTVISGRAAGIVGALLPSGSSWQQDVNLTQETPSFIDVDLYGIDANGAFGAHLDHKRQSFGLGIVPTAPEIGYSTDSLGNLVVTLTVDNDTATVKAVATKGTAPNGSQLASSPSVSKSSGSSLIPVGTIPIGAGLQPALLAGLNTGERYYILAQAYHASGLASDVSALSDVYVAGANDATAQVSYVSTALSDKNIVFRVKPNRHCAEFEVYVKEYSADPGAEIAIDAAYPAPFDAIVVGPDPARYRAQPETNYDLSIPIAGPANYVMLTIVPYDSLARQGARLNKKGQGNGVAAPLAPTNRTISSGPTQTTVDVSVTMPSVVPEKIRIYKDNVLYREDVTTGATANAAFALPQITGLSPSTTYSFTFSGYNASTGVESPTRTAPLTVTTLAASGGNGQIPQPVLTSSHVVYDPAAETWSFTITPGSGTPSGVVWHIDRFTAATPFTSFVEQVNGASTTLTQNDPKDTPNGTDFYFTAWGTMPDGSWSPSLRSNPTAQGAEAATGPIHKTGTGEPSAAPLIQQMIIEDTNACTAEWTNPSDTTDLIYVEFQKLFGGQYFNAVYSMNMPAASTIARTGRQVSIFSPGDQVRARVRYYNSAQNGPWSAFTNTVTIS